MTTPSFLFAVLFITLSNTCLYAQKGLVEKVDKIITKAMTQEKFPGMAIAIVQDNKVIYQKVYGVKSVKTKEPVNDNTIFSIGSVSKAYTAVAIMQLVQAGKIDLDSPIKKFMKGIPPSWGNITIRQYLTHTSGIPDVKGEKDKASFEETLKQAGKLPMAFTPPGKKQQYNNFNFALLGKLIETVSGKTYLDYMTTYIFKPLQMNRTGVVADAKNVALGHLNKNGAWKEIATHFVPGDYGIPSGGLQTTLTDFIKFSQALSSYSILNSKTTNLMWTPYSKKISNTPGWHSRTTGNELVIHKGGGGTGIGSVCDFAVVPSRKLFVLVMANKSNNGISPANVVDDILFKGFEIPADSNGANEGEGNER
ncbi:serine hydrolase [Chitinophaga sp. SYP-B3965]|uniref:serine hydrolase domain-containing protein n=1 Tax=Chitinophaga sp. SYP-B3965 TaxID=2663120 RepID=UPI001299A90A|nr:serine hydrolase domain-containing protein [Chitinophaga sp. SYP-B3965]MRG44230.1 serine hydrolase [Chitinophaga sp. SYP-B3965]